MDRDKWSVPYVVPSDILGRLGWAAGVARILSLQEEEEEVGAGDGKERVCLLEEILDHRKASCHNALARLQI